MNNTFKDGIPRETRKAGFLQSFDRQKLDSRDPGDFASKLLSFVRQNKVAADALVAGNIQMLGMEGLREQFGNRWDSVKEKVHLLVETTIKQHISTDDVYCLINDESFIVLFGKASKEQANKTAHAIGRDVNTKLSGAGAPSDAISVKPVVIEIPRDDQGALNSPKSLENTVEEAQRQAEAAELKPVEKAKDVLRLRFWPVANVRKRLVSCYHAELHVPEGTDLGFDPNEPSATGAVEAALDRMTLQHSGAALVDAASRKMRALLIVPVHFETLAARNFRNAYLEMCKLLPRIAEQRLLLLVRGLPDDVPQGRLHSLFGYVAPFVAGFVGEFSFGFSRADKLGGVKLLAFAVDGSRIEQPTINDINAMKGLMASNKKMKVRRYFHGASSVETATAARRTHFDYVQGAGVAPSMPIAGKVFTI
ncbi:MAG: hypothetical protein HQ481_01200 [Alphaproteobacteria bacterium]|nr:hypothetical protein [Alphaproteobacteria bacterium]